MDTFTPYTALIGGSLIGLATVILLGFNGRIAGISGIMNGVLTREAVNTAWRWSFLVGLIAGAGVFVWFTPPAFAPRTDYPMALTVFAGLLVGVGTRMGSGCTSGHGVCGLARLSPRSVVATVVFLAAGVATVFVVRRLIGI